MQGLPAYIAATLKVRLVDRGNAVLHILSDTMTTLIGLALVSALYRSVPSVRGWSVSEAMLAWGFGEASLGLFFAFFQGLYVVNIRYIVGGELDRVLLRPMDPLVQILLDHLRPQALGVLVVGLLVIAVGARTGTVEWTATPWLMLTTTPVCLLAGVGFWRQHQGTSIGLAYQITAYGRYPHDFLPRPLAWVVTWIVPFSFIGFVPATLYMARPEWRSMALMQPLVGIACMAAGYGFWTFSLRRYSSSGT
jgi:ABC-2 type transport system permease protein